mmetsp:Transcript_5680/g.8464  ORF Transcript_5680/g.8464 Transcript_5680/m.8464 type:complete len:87 (-) Transcript_5680:86-346(-)
MAQEIPKVLQPVLHFLLASMLPLRVCQFRRWKSHRGRRHNRIVSLSIFSGEKVFIFSLSLSLSPIPKELRGQFEWLVMSDFSEEEK